MSARWTFKEDLFLAHYFDAVGDMCGHHDLGKAKGAAKRRVKKLVACGAWDHLQELIVCHAKHHDGYAQSLGLKTFDGDEL